jgi:hypothetical protein
MGLLDPASGTEVFGRHFRHPGLLLMCYIDGTRNLCESLSRFTHGLTDVRV